MGRVSGRIVKSETVVGTDVCFFDFEGLSEAIVMAAARLRLCCYAELSIQVPSGGM